MKKRGINPAHKPVSHSEHSLLLSEKRTHLSEKRTELAHERTLMGYVRTATTLTLFGIAFLGLSKIRLDFFWWTGRIAILIGLGFIILAIFRAIKHWNEIKNIRTFFEHLLHHNRYKK